MRVKGRTYLESGCEDSYCNYLMACGTRLIAAYHLGALVQEIAAADAGQSGSFHHQIMGCGAATTFRSNTCRALQHRGLADVSR